MRKMKTKARAKKHQRITVAAVIERNGRFLMVEEKTRDGIRINQPAGHLENGESLIEAVKRETLEETACHFEPTHLVGIYQWPRPDGRAHYLRFAFGGNVLKESSAKLDRDILRALWLPIGQIRNEADRHRSPLVLQSIEDWLRGSHHPLHILHHHY